MKAKHQRKIGLLLILGLLGTSLGLVLYALSEKVTFFYTPTDIAQGKAAFNNQIRVGGLVLQGSLQHFPNHTVTFTLTDRDHTLPVTFTGIPPNLFREGQGAVCIGILSPEGTFKATSIMAKHDENYTPPEMKN